jgi:hypothetical protein
MQFGVDPSLKANKSYYRSLDPDGLIRTVQRLHDRIRKRFENSGLSNVAGELLEISQEAAARAVWIQSPHIPLRIGIAVLLVMSAGSIAWVMRGLRLDPSFDSLGELLAALEAGANIVLLAGAGVWFLVSLELRLKRGRALQMIHELRVLAHLVDMHQLTKDPENLFVPEDSQVSPGAVSLSPQDLARYLDYCSEMLSLIGKIAALYAQYFDDRDILLAVDEVEDLANAHARKIWQKLMILYQSGSFPPALGKPEP